MFFHLYQINQFWHLNQFSDLSIYPTQGNENNLKHTEKTNGQSPVSVSNQFSCESKTSRNNGLMVVLLLSYPKVLFKVVQDRFTFHSQDHLMFQLGHSSHDISVCLKEEKKNQGERVHANYLLRVSVLSLFTYRKETNRP